MSAISQISPMSHPRRGEVFLASSAGLEFRLAVVSRDKLNETTGLVLVVPMIERARLPNADYDALVVADEWVLMCANVAPLPIKYLTKSLGQLAPAIVAKLDNALRIVLDLG
jgi:mRNA-degrading endonuclease toxin of MazEF toxin-antitoxin module